MDRTTWIGIFVLGILSLDVLVLLLVITLNERRDPEYRPFVPVQRVVIIVIAGLVFAGLALFAAFQLD